MASDHYQRIDDAITNLIQKGVFVRFYESLRGSKGCSDMNNTLIGDVN